MKKMRIEGSFVALITPFNADGTVDFAAFDELLRFQRANGTSAVLIFGSTGEISMLSRPPKPNRVWSSTCYPITAMSNG